MRPPFPAEGLLPLISEKADADKCRILAAAARAAEDECDTFIVFSPAKRSLNGMVHGVSAAK